MNTEEQKIRAAIISAYSEMTVEQIADDVIGLVAKTAEKGFSDGFERAKIQISQVIEDFKDMEKK